MKSRHAIALSLISALSAVGLTQAIADAAPTEPGWFQHHGWGHGRHGGVDRLCADDAATQIDMLIGIVPGLLKLNDAQGEAWQDLAASLRTATTTYGEACAGLGAQPEDANAVERLTRAETLLEAGLAAIAHVRPSFERFYATLDDDQKATVDDMLTGHHGG